MAMREPVAMDFMGVGPAAAAGRNGSWRSSEAAAAGGEPGGLLVRPIPNGVHARKSPEDGGSTITHAFASSGNNLHGLRKQPWSRRFQSEEGYAAVSPKRERASPDVTPDVQAHYLSDNSAPASPSHHNPGEFWRMQQPQPQARKNQTTYAGHLQAGAPRTSPFRDEASQRGDQADPENQPRPPSSQGTFGSPTPSQFQANGAEAMAYKKPPFHNYPSQAGNVHGQAVARPASGGGKQQQQQPSTTQLTIFYAGMVNVYNDVPFDKAQAIMLLAGSGNSWSSNYMSPPVVSGAAAGRNPFLKSPMSAPQSTPSTPGSPTASPQVPTAGGHPPRSGVIFSNVRQPPITNVELPQARKASLARFLEKRKDRTRKPPLNEDVESASASRDKSPGPSTSQPSTRSPSPSPAVQDQHHRASSRAPSGAPSAQPRRDQGSEPNSPPTKPPSTPPRQSGTLDSEKKTLTAPKRRDDSDDQAHFSKRARSGRSHDPDESSSL
nr:putative jasmonate ZIM domain protein 1 [Calohypnum plumiforme]